MKYLILIKENSYTIYKSDDFYVYYFNNERWLMANPWLFLTNQDKYKEYKPMLLKVLFE